MSAPAGNARLVLLLVLSCAACGDDPIGVPPDGTIDLAAPWAESSPAAVGLDGAALDAAGDAADQLDRMRSLLVVRDGRLAYERYYRGWTADTLADVRSVTKSVVSTLAGIAIGQGQLGLDDPVTDYVSSPEFRVRPEHGNVTVRHLLTMTGGFSWSIPEGSEYNSWILSGTHIDYLLDKPLVQTPGQSFAYNSAAVHLLGVVVERATGRSLPSYADEHLFGPLGISVSRWEEMGGGPVNGGAGLDLRPRDLARFGQLFLQEGWSGDEAVIPTGWVPDATRQRFGNFTSFGPIDALSYGYLWWVDLDNGGYFAWGYGGQFVYVLPSERLVVVATTQWRFLSQDPGGPQALMEAVLGIVVDQVLTAVR